MTTLTRSIEDVRRQVAALLDAHPELAEDDDLRADMLEGSTDLDDVLDRLANAAIGAAAKAEAVSKRIEHLAERKRRFETQVSALKAIALTIMAEAGLRKRDLPAATLSITPGRVSVEVPEPAAVPDEFARIKREPDRALIKAALEGGAGFNWARLVTGQPTLTMRSR